MKKIRSITSPIVIDEKSVGLSVMRDLVSFTLSAPVYFLPGVMLLIDLVPLPLPILILPHTSRAEQTAQVCSNRLTYLNANQ